MEINKSFFTDYEERDLVWENLATEYYTQSLLAKSATQKAEDLKKALITLSRGKNSMRGNFVFTKTLRKGAVQYALIPELQEVNLEVYRAPEVESWSIKKI